MKRRILLATLAFAFLFAGCGYTLKTSVSPVLLEQNIQKIYINPVINNTFTPGVENVVYNALQRRIAMSRVVRITRSLEEADAVLSSHVTLASYTPAGYQTADTLPGASTVTGIPKDHQVAIQYSANLTCVFVLRKKSDGKHLWGSTFGRSQYFYANNQVGVGGTTSALINDSEFERALEDMALNLGQNVQETMLSQF